MSKFRFAIALVFSAGLAAESSAQLQVSVPGVTANQQGFSAIRGTDSRMVTIIAKNPAAKEVVGDVAIVGEHADFFSLQSPSTYRIDANGEKSDEANFDIVFSPPTDFIGIASATITWTSDDQDVTTLAIRGLSTKGLEGKNEPTLADVITTLGLTVDVGWETLANHIRPELQGEEIDTGLFTKSDAGNVEIIALARYSPSFELPFGYCTADGEIHQVAVLSPSRQPIPEHQTLYPASQTGTTTFDPGDQPFGIYTTSPTHDAFSIDSLNRAENRKRKKRHAVHACRTYQARDADGQPVPNTYLFCFEEAANGDYQDYVFLVKNIRPVSK